MADLMNLNNPVFKAFAFHVSVLLLKMLAMSLLTARQRFRKLVFASPEDANLKNSKVKYDDPDVERVRRAHLNDLENIPAFIVAAWLFLMTNPPAWLAINLFRAFTVSRVIHTVVYAVVVVPQPARALSWGVGYGITGYMLVHSLLQFI